MKIVAGICCSVPCNCEKQIVYHTNNLGEVQEKKFYCRVEENVEVRTSNPTFANLCEALTLENISFNTNDLIEAICFEDHFYLQLPKSFYDQCEKELNKYISHIPESIKDILIYNIKDEFGGANIRVVTSWNDQTINTVITEVIAEVLYKYDDLVGSGVGS